MEPSLIRRAPKSLCLTTAFAPVPAFLGGLWAWGNIPSGAATGGFSMVSPQYIRYAAGSKEGKRAGGPLHGDTIAQSFSFCNGEGSGWRGGSCFGQRPPSSEGSGLACAAIPPAPPSDVFQNRGTPPVPPAGAAPPAPLLGGRGGASFFTLARRDSLPNLSPYSGAGMGGGWGAELAGAACSEDSWEGAAQQGYRLSNTLQELRRPWAVGLEAASGDGRSS